MEICKIDDLVAFQSELLELLSYAASKAEEEYAKYKKAANKKLYVCRMDGAIAGCIGIEHSAGRICEIKHIAVSPENRGQQIGSQMIGFICRKYGFSSVFAETDRDAVGFYRKNAFEIMSLGEKYPGRERFLCRKESKESQ
ncbi:acetyltransferase (GNAT) family protein [Planomicrobium soli]|uniref:Acetyltransferase (GNAT) family protein n=1 Tax=Planomicrobium soli TaxID=1176648 RepID=A0A2P8H1R1_9BACL|nr:GNAT family N-acetyltransferase [Planomicrobium soli]PSL40140.1 acetyltransferase (GNAT) family protein [Planomicrobium soli]